jgi:hypothetical protein
MSYYSRLSVPLTTHPTEFKQPYLTYLLTYSMEQSPSSEALWFCS